MSLIRPARARFAATVVLLVALAAATFAQNGRGGGRPGGTFGGGFGFGGAFGGCPPPIHNAKYDGKFTFVRLTYSVGPGGYYYRGCIPAWAHGYDTADDNMTRILDAITAVHPRLDQSNLFAIDDPELFKYPIAFMTEAGFWEMSDKEAKSFHDYLVKGGFVIFDDFRPPPRGGGGWEQFEDNMRRVLPQAQIMDMTPADSIFHTFFDIDSFDIIPQYYDPAKPVIRGIYEDNDRTKRLMAIINFNTDVSQFWEFSGTGIGPPVAQSNEAYELGVNYMIYGLTH